MVDKDIEPSGHIYRSDLDPKTAYPGSVNLLEDEAKSPRFRTPLQIVCGVATAVLIAIVVLQTSDYVNNGNGKAVVTDSNSNSNDIKLPSGSGYLAEVEACYDHGNCADPADAALWRSLQETGSKFGLLTTTSKSPDPRILLRETRMMPFPILKKDALYAKTRGPLPEGTEVYVIATAKIEKDGQSDVYLLITPPDSKEFPQYQSFKQFFILESAAKSE